MSIFDVYSNTEHFDEVTLTESLREVSQNDTPAFFQAWRDIIYTCLFAVRNDRNKLPNLYMVVKEWQDMRPTNYMVYMDIENKPFVGPDLTNIFETIGIRLQSIISAYTNEEDYRKLMIPENWENICVGIMCDRSTVCALDAGIFRGNYQLQPHIYNYEEWVEVESKYSFYHDTILTLLKVKHNIEVDSNMCDKAILT